jgi:hypothetical protein
MAAFLPLLALGGSMLYDKFGRSDKMQKVPTMTKEQQSLLKRMSQMLGPQGQLGQGYGNALGLQQQLMDPSSEAVNQFAQPYMNQFEQQTVPGLAERFAGFGGMGGGLSSSGFGQALGAAGGNLQAQLAQLKAGLGQNAANSLMQQYGNMSGQVLGAQPFAYQQQGPSMTGGMLQGWAQGGFGGMQPFMGVGGYQNKFPLTSGYDQMFRQGGVY